MNEAYLKECKKLDEVFTLKRKEIYEKYKDEPMMLDSKRSSELRKLTKWFSAELKQIQAKHGIVPKKP